MKQPQLSTPPQALEPVILQLAKDILRASRSFCKIREIFLISRKHDARERLTSFKLALITDGVSSQEPVNPAEIEGTLYLNVDCDVPFDLLVYASGQWDDLIQESNTFAARIQKTGVTLHGPSQPIL